jgi:hypothetical protein
MAAMNMVSWRSGELVNSNQGGVRVARIHQITISPDHQLLAQADV